MKTIASAMLALTVLAGIVAPASATDAKSFYAQQDREVSLAQHIGPRRRWPSRSDRSSGPHDATEGSDETSNQCSRARIGARAAYARHRHPE